jgi:hypothetical protein
MTNEELEKVAELVAVICKDRYLRQKLITTPEFAEVAGMVAPGMLEVISVFAERYNNVREEA